MWCSRKQSKFCKKSQWRCRMIYSFSGKLLFYRNLMMRKKGYVRFIKVVLCGIFLLQRQISSKQAEIVCLTWVSFGGEVAPWLSILVEGCLDVMAPPTPWCPPQHPFNRTYYCRLCSHRRVNTIVRYAHLQFVKV